MRILSSNPNVDNSDIANYPDGRIKDNTGSGDGTGVNERVYGDLHSNISKLLRLYGITPNNSPDNETNGYQIIDGLRALSTKNTIVQNLSSEGGKLKVPFKISFLLEGETMLCKASVNFTTETEIKGADVTVFGLTVVSTFTSGDYVQFIKTASGVELRRVADQSNLDAIVGALNYLKAATQSQENAGTANNVATTPLTNLTAFIRRVNGADSATYLATALQNGIYPKEHFAIVAALGANPVRNIGRFSGFDINNGAIGTTFTVSGNLVSATLTAKPSNSSVVRVVLANTMTNTDYYVRAFLQSNSANFSDDNGGLMWTFKPINATTFDFCIREFVSQNQNLTVHIEVVKY